MGNSLSPPGCGGASHLRPGSDPGNKPWAELICPVRSAVGLTFHRTEDVQAWSKQWKLFSFDLPNFLGFFGGKLAGGTTEAREFFELVLEPETNLVDSLEVFGVLILMSTGSSQRKMGALFQLFAGDLEDDRELPEAALALLLEKVTTGLAKLCTGVPASVPTLFLKQWAKCLMRHQNMRGTGTTWSKEEFERWWVKDYHVQGLLNVFGRQTSRETDEESQLVNSWHSVKLSHVELLQQRIKKVREAQSLSRFKSGKLHVFLPEKPHSHYLYIPDGLWFASELISDPSGQPGRAAVPVASTLNNTIHWPNGGSTIILPGGRLISPHFGSEENDFTPSTVFIKGKQLTLELHGSSLFWSDGDVWKLKGA